MRILCLDVGRKRIGAAVSDELGITAQGIETIPNTSMRESVNRVLALCERFETTRVLCGLPLNLDGHEGEQAEYSRQFADKLTRAGLTVRFQDERMTTRLARDVLVSADVSRKKRKESIDKLAAVLILQTCLDSGGWKEDKSPKHLRGGIYRMDENKNPELELDQDQEQENLIELVDEDGQSVAFEHLMTLEHEGHSYICLVPAEPMEDVEEDELVIMRIDTDEEGNDYYTTLDDEDELEAVYNSYLEIAEADDEP